MKLHCVTVTNVYPLQCVTVMERESSAIALRDHLNAVISDNVVVKEVDSFFPKGMTQADDVWMKATESYMLGYHINTSGDPA